MLVDLNIKNMKPKTHTYFVADEGACPGLVVRVTPAGNKAFVLRMKKDGKRKTKTIGTYGQISLSEARKEGLKLRGQISLGEDVFNKEPANDPEPQEQGTLKDLWKLHIEDAERRGVRKAYDMKKAFELNVPIMLYNKPANEVTTQDIVGILKPIIARGSVGQSVKVRG